MIIFDLDGTLADCEHRRHFVDPSKRDDCVLWMSNTTKEEWIYRDGWDNPKTRKKFKPDWDAFYQACDKDTPNRHIVDLLEYLGEAAEYGSDTASVDYSNIQIWSARCESVRGKTERWLGKNVKYYLKDKPILKMRTKGDYTPDDELKERWLDEHIASGVNAIEMVFDDRQKVVDMWRRRGITCLQVAPGDF